MVNFKELDLNPELHSKLDNLQVDFAFQPIYRANDMYFVGYEALMRPVGKTPLELIEQYRKFGDLHLLELVTLFGACKAYYDRGYDCLLSINSFPVECMTDEEEQIFHNCFPEIHMKMVLEIVEYTDYNESNWETKQKQLRLRQIGTALDDFGIGNHQNEEAADLYHAAMVKLDRTLICDIQNDVKKQEYVKEYIEHFHKKNILVLAEGIEKEEEYAYLKTIGIDFVQGFYFGKPM